MVYLWIASSAAFFARKNNMPEINPKNLPVGTSAGGVIVRLDDEWLVALTREAHDTGEIWYLPKGHIESGETIEMAARREIEEETGLSEFSHWQYVGERQRESMVGTEWKIIHYFFGITRQAELKPIATDKVHVAQWFPLFGEVPVCTEEQREMLQIAKTLVNVL